LTQPEFAAIAGADPKTVGTGDRRDECATDTCSTVETYIRFFKTAPGEQAALGGWPKKRIGLVQICDGVFEDVIPALISQLTGKGIANPVF
jgi:hypothetical protein